MKAFMFCLFFVSCSQNGGNNIDDVNSQFQELEVGGDLDEEQKERLQQFLQSKKKVGDSLSSEDLIFQGELGAGNGGVVNKVIHSRSSQVMARKVCILIYNS